MNASGVGFMHFVAQTDPVGKVVLLMMMVMSIASLYVIATRAIRHLAIRRRSRFFCAQFAAGGWALLESDDGSGPGFDPWRLMAEEAMAARRQHSTNGGRGLVGAGTFDAFLTRALRRSLSVTATRLESGLTVLASIGSAAPFIGLFGTVWGIYHALLAIGVSGQGTLDRVAGPVGEALIMTAIGLVVAIPAVLAYNAFVRTNRVTLAALDDFAHELFVSMTLSDVRPAGSARMRSASPPLCEID